MGGGASERAAGPCEMWWRLALALAYAGSPLVGFRAPLERRSAPRASEVAEDHRLHRARAVVEALRREGPPEQASSELEQRASSGQHDAGSVRATHLDQAVVDYDPEGSARRFAKQPMRVLRRQLELALPLAAFALSVLMDVALGVERANRPARAAELLALISRCGPAVIKAGQALASRSDLLPAEYLAELQRLQDDVPPFPSDVAFEVLRQELGVPPSELFASISAEPIAAASLGQVYKAVRKSTGEPLAIKIQRPGSLEVAELDLHILRGCAQLLNALIRAFERDVDVVGVIDDFGTLLLGELDYRKEAANAQRFVALYARARDKVGAPAVFPELTTRRVLVEGWVEGVRLTDRAALAAHGLSSQQLVQSLVRCSLRQMLEDGFFHAGALPPCAPPASCPRGPLSAWAAAPHCRRARAAPASLGARCRGGGAEERSSRTVGGANGSVLPAPARAPLPPPPPADAPSVRGRPARRQPARHAGRHADVHRLWDGLVRDD